MKKFGHLVKVSSAAAWLNCSKSHVYNLIEQQKLEAVRIGDRSLRVTTESLESLMQKTDTGE